MVAQRLKFRSWILVFHTFPRNSADCLLEKPGHYVWVLWMREYCVQYLCAMSRDRLSLFNASVYPSSGWSVSFQNPPVTWTKTLNLNSSNKNWGQVVASLEWQYESMDFKGELLKIRFGGWHTVVAYLPPPILKIMKVIYMY